MRALLVDDEPSIRFLNRVLLEERGVEVADESGGLAALDRLGRERFDAVVLDHRMPDLTGTEVAIRLREAGDQTPLVIYTGWSSDEMEASLAGLDVRVVPKDDPHALVDWVAGAGSA
ncbi:response regulator [Conexibacter sp. SYSU D00693]|uniref:response regulator n=1 Tax=Conexibacter sp. SYSU D00693 TaxID=2812560 RepID=UPI00196A9DBF|nr:response regulator [Conexibacter sp. SYSU D00693]